MTYAVRFSPASRKSWNKLDPSIPVQFQKALRRRVEEPHVPAARLHGWANLYKIKLRGVGYRLAYQVRDAELIIVVVGVGRRDELYDDLKRAGRQSLSGLD
jgi:mRNA interferase RelE/StbE